MKLYQGEVLGQSEMLEQMKQGKGEQGLLQFSPCPLPLPATLFKETQADEAISGYPEY